MERKGGPVKPTFWKTVDAVAEHYMVDRELIRSALVRLIEAGYIEEKDLYIGMKKTIRGLVIDWSELEKDGVWPVRHSP